MSRDTWAGDENLPMSYNAWLYTYANPINHVDPSGFVACSLNFRYCKIIGGAYEGFFIDTDHWDDSRHLSQDVNEKLQELVGVPLGKFQEGVLLAGFAPYVRDYYTRIPMGMPSAALDSMTLGILMDYNLGLENFEGIDPACLLPNAEIAGHLCSSFSNEDLPSAYLGFVAYKNSWNLKETLSKLVANVEEDTEGTNDYPDGVAKKYWDAQNHCFAPKIFDSSTGQFANQSWPSDILYDAMGPGEYWATHPTAFVPPLPTPTPNPTPVP